MNRVIPMRLRLRLRLIRKARLLCALMLLFAFLSAGAPLVASLASGPSPCERACCAGKAPHAAGSCGHGSCHASLSSRRKSLHLGRKISQPAEQLCGVSRRVDARGLVGVRSLRKLSLGLTGGTPVPRTHSRQNNSDQTKVTLASLSRPCQSECGGASSANANQRNAAALRHDRHPRPLSSIRLAALNHFFSKLLEALSRHYAPRGPPFSFS